MHWVICILLAFSHLHMSNALLRLSVLVTRWVVNTQLGSCLLSMQQHIMQVALLQAYVSMGLDNKYI